MSNHCHHQSVDPVEACPDALKRTETRTRQCNVLACPADCCFWHSCPFLADLICDDTTCHPFINMTVCDPIERGSESFDSTVQGREVSWSFSFWFRSHVVALLDKDTGFTSSDTLNKTTTEPTMPTKRSFCECLGGFARKVLRKKFSGSCLDF